MNDEWESVVVAGRRAVSVNGNMVTIEWDLGGGFDREWGQVFRGDGARAGSLDFVYGTGGEPRATMERRVVWTVPEKDIEGADNYVQKAVAITNDNYRTLQVRKEREAQEARERAAAEDERLGDVQSRLDKLN